MFRYILWISYRIFQFISMIHLFISSSLACSAIFHSFLFTCHLYFLRFNLLLTFIFHLIALARTSSIKLIINSDIGYPSLILILMRENSIFYCEILVISFSQIPFIISKVSFLLLVSREGLFFVNQGRKENLVKCYTYWNYHNVFILHSVNMLYYICQMLTQSWISRI